MAKKEKTTAPAAKSSGAVKKDDVKPTLLKRIGKWFRDMKSELKKVVWPNKQHVMKNTGTVLLCSVAIGVCIWIFDFVATSAVQMLLNVFGA